MIIASIAMEELALSRIVNAEGEKLQYILGTLPGGPEVCAGTREVLAANKSVKELLDTVMQSQMLLKGKLERALEAGGCAPAPEPPCPCGPVCPDGPACGGEPCCRKSAIQLAGRCSGHSWDSGSPMLWKCREQRGRDIRWNEKTPALVRFNPQKTYMLNYTINIRDSDPGNAAGAVFVKITPYGAFSPVLPLWFSVKCTDCEPLTLHYSTMLFPQACPEPWADLSLLLKYRDIPFVDQASLCMAEL